MSIRTVSASPTTSNAGLNTKSLQDTTASWKRNPQWIAIPEVLSTDQKMVGLHAIFPSSNFLALVAAGDYTVNWGDGVTENFAANVVAYHQYDYTNAAFDGTLTDLGYKQAIVTVTPQAGQNLTYLNLNQKHNQANLQTYVSGFLQISVSSAELTDLRVSVTTPSSTSGVINFNLLEQFNLVNSDCKQLNGLFYGVRSLQSIGNFVTSTDAAVTGAVTFTNTGDLITFAGHGFRNGDSVVFTSITGSVGLLLTTSYYVINVTTDTFQVSSTYGGGAINLTADGTGTVVYGTAMDSTFFNCSSLLSVPLFNTASVITMISTFSSCVSLTSVPLFNTSSVVLMGTMFSGCSSLLSVPLFNTAAVTNMSTMFNGCVSLTSVPLFNTASVTSMSNMFSGCTSLLSVPLFNTAAVTNMSSMFSACVSLKSFPLFNTAAVTNMGFMFSGCSGLKSVPLFNTASVTTMQSMFQNCFSLTSVPLFNTAAVTAMQSMFNSCSSLLSVPLFNTAAVTNMGTMFSNCLSLTSVPALVTTAVTNSSNFMNMFATCPSLTRIEAKNFRFTFSVASCKLSGTALNEIYTNLPSVTAQTITVTGNYGTATDTPSIATAKGWTVTG